MRGGGISVRTRNLAPRRGASGAADAPLRSSGLRGAGSSEKPDRVSPCSMQPRPPQRCRDSHADTHSGGKCTGWAEGGAKPGTRTHITASQGRGVPTVHGCLLLWWFHLADWLQCNQYLLITATRGGRDL